MKTLQIDTITDRDGHLRLDMPLACARTHVSLTLLIDDTSPRQARYDCSDLLGKLKWQGDAVKAQRALREQWE